MVAQAIYDCSTPIISAVGHETDTTIADFVADVRAETPSAGAQIAVCEIDKVFGIIDDYREDLCRNMSRAIELERNKAELYKNRLMRLSPASQIKDKRYLTMQLEDNLKKQMLNILDKKKYELGLKAGRLNGVSPLAKLNQGYSYARSDKSGNIKSIEQVAAGDEYELFVSDGVIRSVVKDTESIERNV